METDNSLDLHRVSILLQRTLVADLKEIARAKGMPYQTLARSILTQWVADQKAKQKA